jgi:hypothetical protein
VSFVQGLNLDEIERVKIDWPCTPSLRYSCRRLSLCGPTSEVPSPIWGKLMTTDSYRGAMRPLLLTVAWFAFLAGAAFAWAALETRQPASSAPAPEAGKTIALSH